MPAPFAIVLYLMYYAWKFQLLAKGESRATAGMTFAATFVAFVQFPFDMESVCVLCLASQSVGYILPPRVPVLE